MSQVCCQAALRLALVALAVAVSARPALTQTIFRRAIVDSTGELHIEWSDGRSALAPRDSGQVAFDQVKVSADHRTLGWVALYTNSGPSYPLPLKLILLRAGGQRTEIGNAFPIWQWGFTKDGRSVVIRQAPVHGDLPTYYEHRDIATGVNCIEEVARRWTLQPFSGSWCQTLYP